MTKTDSIIIYNFNKKRSSNCVEGNSGELGHICMKSEHSAACCCGGWFTNEVSGTRGITLDLFLSSPYLSQTFTLFTSLLRARSGQLSFVKLWLVESYWTMPPSFRQGRCSARPYSRSHTLDTHLRFNAYWYLFFFCWPWYECLS